MMKSKSLVFAGSLMALMVFAGAAMAQARYGDERREWRGESFRLDPRYHHNHYYPVVGYAVPVLPNGSISITFGVDRLYFHGGVWWRPVGGRFVVVVPPIGVAVPLLPPDCVTLWIGGAPYYYANGVYYAASPGQGYVVVQPPPGAETAQMSAPVAVVPAPAPIPVPIPAPAPKAPPVPVIYPRNGQSATQTEADRQECNRWATTQASALADGEVFQRSVAACMDAHGYTVR